MIIGSPKYFISVFLTVLIISFSIQNTSSSAETVNIPDANLRMMIEDALVKASSETITKAEMKSLTRLTANKGVNDLEGLQFATNLTYLHLAAQYFSSEQHQWIHLNEISDLSPLAGLTKLTYINIPTNSNITDLSPLSSLSNLTELRLWNNNITDLSPLSGLINLRVLDVSSNDRLSDLSPLSKLINLRDLSAYFNDITDITPLSKLTNLEFLNLDYNNGIPDITPLTNLTKLVSLGIAGNNIVDISALLGLTSLSFLSIADNNIIDITALSGLTSLTTLRLGNDTGNNKFTNISVLAGLTNLRTLWLQKSNITDISALSGLTSLRSLWLQENNIADISPLVDNLGFCDGGEVDLRDNPLSVQSINTYIPTLRARGVEVDFDDPTDPANEILLTVDDEPKIYNDNVFVLPVSEDLATDELPLTTYTEKFYTYFEDNFDFLILISNLDFGEDRHGYFGQHHSVKNDTQGIGLDTYSNNQLGSTSTLQSMIHFTYYFAMSNGPTLHEVMHRWANFIVPQQYAGPHWGFTSANGQIGGFDAANLVDHGDNRYTAGDFTLAGYAYNTEPYSPIELYLAGFIPPEEVPDLLVAEDGAPLLDQNGTNVLINGNPVFTASSIKTYTIEDIIAEHGSRIPDHSQAQRNFRAAAILLIDKDHPAIREKLHTVSESVSWFTYAGDDEFNQSYNFYEATGGRGTMKMDNLSQFQKSTQTLQSIPVVPAGISEYSLTDIMDTELPTDTTACEHPDHTGTPRGSNGNVLLINPTYQIIISEIMVASNGGSLPQWIELYNPSNADEANLKDWKLEIQNWQSENFNGKLNVTINFKERKIKPQDTLLVVSKQGRYSDNFPNDQIYNLNRLHPNLQGELLSEKGFHIKLTKSGELIDAVGNLNVNQSTNGKISWSLPKSMTKDGARTSMVRRYNDGIPALGIEETGWISAKNTKLLTHTTMYYGHPDDIGAPGVRSGGALPVTLSHFRAELADAGVILKWTTESEVDNAGFYIYRSQTRDGEFKVVNPTMIQGAGTTSERNEYTWTDTTAKPNVAYYYRIEDLSHAGVREQLATVRLKGLVSASGKLTTKWADLKIQNSVLK